MTHQIRLQVHQGLGGGRSLVENIGDMLLRTVDRLPVKPLRLAGPVDI
jgi:hypothetical protein